MNSLRSRTVRETNQAQEGSSLVPDGSRPSELSPLRMLFLASLGGALEFYDFVIFVFFTSVLEKLFFAPSTADWTGLAQTFGIFAVGYLARPLGGIVIGHFGDTRGRKRMFTLSVLLMAIPTLLMGLLPTYSSIGVAAPLLLLVLRVMQGVAIGGEAPGAWVFVAEHTQKGTTGFAVGLLTSGLSFGILLGSLMATGIHLAFTPSQVAAGAWRIPFLVGGVFGFAAMWLRQWLKETPVFEEMQRRAAVSRQVPLLVVLRGHGRAVIASMASTWMLTAAIVVIILLTPSLLPKLFGLPSGAVQTANLAATVALCVSTIALGAATDRFGIRRVAVAACTLLIASVYALYCGVGMQPSALLPLSVFAGLGTGAVALAPIAIVNAFPSGSL